MPTSHVAVVNFAQPAGSVELRLLPLPEIGSEDVLLEVGYVGVCGSDLHQWLNHHSWTVNYPVTLGHEFAGRISVLGAAVTGFAVGDRVVSETAAIIDANSPLTRRGLYNLDPTRKGFGYGVHGAMTRFVRVPARCLHRVPKELPLQIAALTEPCCVAYNAVVNNSRIVPGDRVIVLGPGPIGILCAAMAQLQGAAVTLVGLPADAVRLGIAQKAYGFRVFDGDVTTLKAEGDGLGAEVIMDAAGVSASLKTALELVRPAGWITKVGWGPQPLNFSLDPLVQKNVTLQGSFSHNWPVWERVLQLLATRRLVIAPLIGGVWPLERWNEAFTEMHAGRVVKSVLQPALGIH
jgi:L-iditol 2-dehydrogenase